MDMVLGYMPFYDVHRFSPTNFADHFPRFEGNISHQYRLAALGNPNQMRMNGKNTAHSMMIIAHAPQIKQETLKLPAKNWGFVHPKLVQ
jgi:hypothetical protein